MEHMKSWENNYTLHILYVAVIHMSNTQLKCDMEKDSF